MKELILGGVRSGKSRLAEQHAQSSGLPVTVLATAKAADAEMQRRISEHRRRRPSSWTTVEEPYALIRALREHAREEHCLLVDCLTLWITNLLCTGDDATLQQERDALVDALPRLPGHIILVSNESGMGVIPVGELTRRFCDEIGRLHQDLAQVCDRVILTFAGLPHVLKGGGL